ncbi:MAG: HAMP domain-containing histidine kinase [Ruminiclostridium sp.]|nr:HAMP domain-containing histidine kinase [Ruminiclostridium sp.]
MIRKLRKSFIVTAMISVIAVLAVIVCAMNALNFINTDNEADTLIELLAENGGSFPDFRGNGMNGQGIQPDDRAVPPEDMGELPEDIDVQRRGMFSPDRRFGDRMVMTAETPYETRFFTVTLDSSGSPVTSDTTRIAAVGTQDALEMAQRLYASGAVRGYEGTLKYLIQRGEDSTLCIFLDRSRALLSVKDFMISSLLVSLAAVIGIAVLVFIFSGAAIKPVAESYEKQKKFITDAGHEIKTPLTVITTCTEVIEAEQGESKWTTGIRAQTERLTELTKDLIALARMDEGGTRPEREDFSLSETLTEILDPFMMISEHRDVTFTADIQPDIIFNGDRRLIAKLCSILADNAVKYTPDGGSIAFTLSRKGKRITLVSENTSEPMEKGAHPELFDRFRRGDSSHSSDKPGYGIGLSMAQSVVQAHGGRIEAFSKDGKSLTITVRL